MPSFSLNNTNKRSENERLHHLTIMPSKTLLTTHVSRTHSTHLFPCHDIFIHHASSFCLIFSFTLATTLIYTHFILHDPNHTGIYHAFHAAHTFSFFSLSSPPFLFNTSFIPPFFCLLFTTNVFTTIYVSCNLENTY